MKKLSTFMVGCVIAGLSFAGDTTKPAQLQTASDLKNQQQQEQQSTSGAISQNAGNHQIIIFEAPEKTVVETTVRGTQTLRNVPSVGGPALTSSNDTCMGSTSASVNVAGFGGSYGTTWTDANCVMLKNSREFWNMGFQAASIARMCMDDLNREALELTGFECPKSKKEQKPSKEEKVTSSISGPDMTDEHIRRRLGVEAK
jgi:hypothetical protein